MAHTKAQGSVRGNRDSISKRLGVKLYAGENADSGNIIISRSYDGKRLYTFCYPKRDCRIYYQKRKEICTSCSAKIIDG